MCSAFVIFNAPATTEIYTLSLHDALPISHEVAIQESVNTRRGVDRCLKYAFELSRKQRAGKPWKGLKPEEDRKSTRLNSSHTVISYAVFCLKKKKICTRISMNEFELMARL